VNFDVMVTQGASCSRVVVQGEAKLGRMLSLLQVLDVDCRSWPHDRLLLDLRQYAGGLAPGEQERLAAETARLLGRMRRIACLAPPGRMAEAGRVRVFADEGAALRWLLD
jgi:hypothetical protein